MFLPIPLDVFHQQLFKQLCHLEEQKYLGAKTIFFFQFWHKTANFNLSETKYIVFVIISTEAFLKELSDSWAGTNERPGSGRKLHSMAQTYIHTEMATLANLERLYNCLAVLFLVCMLR